MTIQYFAAHQTDVFVPALAIGVLAALLVALPVVLAPGLRRARRGRLVVTACAVLAAAALVLAGQQTAVDVATLHAQRERVAAELRSGYGLQVDAAAAQVLVDGGGVPATDTGGVVRPVAKSEHALRLRFTGGAYVPTFRGQPLPRQA